MTLYKAHKVLTAPIATDNDAVYHVENGTGFDLFTTKSNGVLLPLNAQLEVNKAVKVVPSLTINVPEDKGTIQLALDEAAKFISLDGRVIISLATGEYTLSEELRQSSNQYVEITARSSVVPLRKAGYSGVKATDLITAKGHHNVVINNTVGNLTFLGGNKNLNIQFTGILFNCLDADNYVLYLRENEYAYFLNCTIFGGSLGLSVYDGSQARLTQTTFLHQELRSMYVWNNSIINSDRTSFLYSPRACYIIESSSAYFLRTEVDATVAAFFCQHGSSTYIRGGDYTTGSYIFYTTNGSNTYVLTSPTIPGIFTSALIGYVYHGATLQLQGTLTDFDMTGISGTYVARALYKSNLLLSVAINNKTARLDYSSAGTASTATCTFSPAKTIIGNNNSLWN